MTGRLFALVAGVVLCGPVLADRGGYRLDVVEVAPDVYAVLGAREHFTRANGGNIVNTGFIVTGEGVVVIDTGPSRLYGIALREAIARHTDQPVVRVFVTHLHPDHMLGNQAFEDVPIAALPGTIDGIRREGEAFTDAMYAMVGDWMRGTELVVPTETVEPGTISVGGHAIRLLALSGHSSADLAVYDETTGVLFAGDLVFRARAPTTPHATLAAWEASLDTLADLAPRVLVPGHGPVGGAGAGVAGTRGYLAWLDATFRASAARGLDMNEVMATPIPSRYRELSVLPEEFHRSVTHLYPGYEARTLAPGN